MLGFGATTIGFAAFAEKRSQVARAEISDECKLVTNLLALCIALLGILNVSHHMPPTYICKFDPIYRKKKSSNQYLILPNKSKILTCIQIKNIL